MPRFLSLVACVPAVASALTRKEFDWIVGPLAGTPGGKEPRAPAPKDLTVDAVRTARAFAAQCRGASLDQGREARLHFEFDMTLAVRHASMELMYLSMYGIDHILLLYEMDVRAEMATGFTALRKPSRFSALWAFGTQPHVDNLIAELIHIRQACGPNCKIVINTTGYIGPIMYLLAGAADSSGTSLLDVFDLVGGKGSSTNEYARVTRFSRNSRNSWCGHDLTAQPDQPDDAAEYFAKLGNDIELSMPYETDAIEHRDACAAVRYLMAAMAIDKSAGHVRDKFRMFDRGVQAKVEVVIDDSPAPGFGYQLNLDTAPDVDRTGAVGQYQLNLLRNYLVTQNGRPIPQLHWGISAGEASETAAGVSGTLRLFAATLASELGEYNLGGKEPWFQHKRPPVPLPALFTAHFDYAPVSEEPSHMELSDGAALRQLALRQRPPSLPKKSGRQPAAGLLGFAAQRPNLQPASPAPPGVPKKKAEPGEPARRRRPRRPGHSAQRLTRAPLADDA